MKKLKLIIREKGRFITIPGISSFRSPAEVDVSKVKISILIQSLHSCGVDDYEIKTVSKSGETVKSYSKNETELPEKKKETPKIDKRLDRMEELLLTLLSKNRSQKNNNSEQIENRVMKIERVLKSGNKLPQQELWEKTKSPIVEEMEDQYIPNIDISGMKISGNTTEVVERKSKKDVDDAANALSSLTKNGGK